MGQDWQNEEFPVITVMVPRMQSAAKSGSKVNGSYGDFYGYRGLRFIYIYDSELIYLTNILMFMNELAKIINFYLYIIY